MCAPKAPAVAAAPAPTIPSIQSASALELGGDTGVPRGAAQLGRLQLRLSGAPGATPSQSPTPSTSPTTASPSASSAQTGATGTDGVAADAGGPAYKSPNGALRFNQGGQLG